MRTRAIRAQTGLEAYDAAIWRDWLPCFSHVHRLGPISTLRQSVPAGATGSNETDVAPNDKYVLLMWQGQMRRSAGRIGGRPFEVDHGRDSMCLLPAGIDSWWLSTPQAADGVVHVHIDQSFVSALFAQDGVTTDVAAQPHFHDRVIATLVDDLLASQGETGGPSRLMWESYASAIALRLARRGGASAAPNQWPQTGNDWRIRRSLEEIESRLHEDLGLVELAAAVGLSPSHYACLFRSAMGMPPHAWLIRRRIERACDLLLNPRIAITDIALALGFPSSQHFATTFRKQMGATPSEWRRRRLM